MKSLLGAVLVALLLASCAAAQSTCNASGSRLDCEQYSQSTCVAAGCCWSEVNPNPSNEPWCFYTNSGSPVCDSSRARVDCGYDGITQQECSQRNCCWDAINPDPENLPYCYFSNGLIKGYAATNVQDTDVGFSGTLSTIAGDPNLQYGTPISPLKFDVSYDTATRAHVKIYDPNDDRWEIPQSVIPRTAPTTAASDPEYEVTITESPFGFAVTRGIDEAVVFNTSIPLDSEDFNGLQFKSQYLSVATQLPYDSHIYGFQEASHISGFELVNATYTLWNHDTPASVTGLNLYGSHPFYLQVLPNGNAHGVLLLNSNGMDVTVGPDSILYNVVGGVLDFYIFLGPSPDEVIQQYSQFIGLPKLENYWAFGFHQCRYGMPNIGYVEEVVANYTAANIPLDTIWSDIDYMDAYKDWTWDPVNYPVTEVANFTATLHQEHRQYVVIVDPGINIDASYSSYNNLIDSGAYIYDVNGNPFEGQVWPGYTIFPDFLNPAAADYWENEIQQFLGQVPYDGLWIDMNEISNFCNGECTNGGYIPPSSTTCGCSSTSSFTSYADIEDMYHLTNDKRRFRQNYASANTTDPENPPYAINNDASHDPLNAKTVDVNALHYGNVLEYDSHNIYGLTEAIATNQALASITNKRPFVLTRSSFAGSGQHTAHWSGDNESVWQDLYLSIVNMLAFNNLAMPMVGSDICGFNGDTTEELCSRWIELGAFYPFSRNHNTVGSTDQELYRWPTVAAISAQILSVRYALLPEYYTQHYLAHTTGSAVIRPLFFQYPTDANTFAVDTQFLVGSSLMVAPVLEQGATTVDAYFPAGVWYDYYQPGNAKTYSVGTWETLPAPLDTINLFFRGGSVVVRHTYPALTTYETRLGAFNVTVALDTNGEASGDFYLDDGSSLQPSEYNLAAFSASSNSLTSTISSSSYDGEFNSFATSVQVLGVQSAVSAVTLNGSPITSFTYDSASQTLLVDNLQLSLSKTFTLAW